MEPEPAWRMVIICWFWDNLGQGLCVMDWSWKPKWKFGVETSCMTLTGLLAARDTRVSPCNNVCPAARNRATSSCKTRVSHPFGIPIASFRALRLHSTRRRSRRPRTWSCRIRCWWWSTSGTTPTRCSLGLRNWRRRGVRPRSKRRARCAIWVWLKMKQEGQTAGFGLCFYLPGFHFGYLF